MKLLQKTDVETQAALMRQFPELQAVREIGPHSMGRVAISIFDHWLHDEKEWHLMDCFDGLERIARDKRFLEHWGLLFDSTSIYTVRYRGRWQNNPRLVLKRYVDKNKFLEDCRFDPRQSPKQFIVMPEFDCIYVANWDDTNVLFFNARRQAEPVLDLAKKCGLYTLEYET